MDRVELLEHRGTIGVHRISRACPAAPVEIRAVFEDSLSRGVLAKVPDSTPHGFRHTFVDVAAGRALTAAMHRSPWAQSGQL